MFLSKQDAPSLRDQLRSPKSQPKTTKRLVCLASENGWRKKQGRGMINTKEDLWMTEPTKIQGINKGKAIQIQKSDAVELVLTENGEVFARGTDTRRDGILGLGKGIFESKEFKQILSLQSKKIVQISLGSTHACAVDDQGVLYSWGRGSNGLLAQLNSSTDSIKEISLSSPQEITLPDLKGKVKEVICRSNTTNVLTKKGAIMVMGSLSKGDNTTADQTNQKKKQQKIQVQYSWSTFVKLCPQEEWGGCALTSKGEIVFFNKYLTTDKLKGKNQIKNIFATSSKLFALQDEGLLEWDLSTLLTNTFFQSKNKQSLEQNLDCKFYPPKIYEFGRSVRHPQFITSPDGGSLALSVESDSDDDIFADKNSKWLHQIIQKGLGEQLQSNFSEPSSSYNQKGSSQANVKYPPQINIIPDSNTSQQGLFSSRSPPTSFLDRVSQPPSVPQKKTFLSHIPELQQQKQQPMFQSPELDISRSRPSVTNYEQKIANEFRRNNQIEWKAQLDKSFDRPGKKVVTQESYIQEEQQAPSRIKTLGNQQLGGSINNAALDRSRSNSQNISSRQDQLKQTQQEKAYQKRKKLIQGGDFDEVWKSLKAKPEDRRNKGLSNKEFTNEKDLQYFLQLIQAGSQFENGDKSKLKSMGLKNSKINSFLRGDQNKRSLHDAMLRNSFLNEEQQRSTRNIMDQSSFEGESLLFKSRSNPFFDTFKQLARQNQDLRIDFRSQIHLNQYPRKQNAGKGFVQRNSNDYRYETKGYQSRQLNDSSFMMGSQNNILSDSIYKSMKQYQLQARNMNSSQYERAIYAMNNSREDQNNSYRQNKLSTRSYYTEYRPPIAQSLNNSAIELQRKPGISRNLNKSTLDNPRTYLGGLEEQNERGSSGEADNRKRASKSTSQTKRNQIKQHQGQGGITQDNNIAFNNVWAEEGEHENASPSFAGDNNFSGHSLSQKHFQNRRGSFGLDNEDHKLLKLNRYPEEDKTKKSTNCMSTQVLPPELQQQPEEDVAENREIEIQTDNYQFEEGDQILKPREYIQKEDAEKVIVIQRNSIGNQTALSEKAHEEASLKVQRKNSIGNQTAFSDEEMEKSRSQINMLEVQLQEKHLENERLKNMMKEQENKRLLKKKLKEEKTKTDNNHAKNSNQEGQERGDQAQGNNKLEGQNSNAIEASKLRVEKETNAPMNDGSILDLSCSDVCGQDKHDYAEEEDEGEFDDINPMIMSPETINKQQEKSRDIMNYHPDFLEEEDDDDQEEEFNEQNHPEKRQNSELNKENKQTQPLNKKTDTINKDKHKDTQSKETIPSESTAISNSKSSEFQDKKQNQTGSQEIPKAAHNKESSSQSKHQRSQVEPSEESSFTKLQEHQKKEEQHLPNQINAKQNNDNKISIEGKNDNQQENIVSPQGDYLPTNNQQSSSKDEQTPQTEDSSKEVNLKGEDHLKTDQGQSTSDINQNIGITNPELKTKKSNGINPQISEEQRFSQKDAESKESMANLKSKTAGSQINKQNEQSDEKNDSINGPQNRSDQEKVDRNANVDDQEELNSFQGNQQRVNQISVSHQADSSIKQNHQIATKSLENDNDQDIDNEGIQGEHQVLGEKQEMPKEQNQLERNLENNRNTEQHVSHETRKSKDNNEDSMEGKNENIKGKIEDRSQQQTNHQVEADSTHFKKQIQPEQVLEHSLSDGNDSAQTTAKITRGDPDDNVKHAEQKNGQTSINNNKMEQIQSGINQHQSKKLETSQSRQGIDDKSQQQSEQDAEDDQFNEKLVEISESQIQGNQHQPTERQQKQLVSQTEQVNQEDFQGKNQGEQNSVQTSLASNEVDIANSQPDQAGKQLLENQRVSDEQLNQDVVQDNIEISNKQQVFSNKKSQEQLDSLSAQKDTDQHLIKDKTNFNMQPDEASSKQSNQAEGKASSTKSNQAEDKGKRNNEQGLRTQENLGSNNNQDNQIKTTKTGQNDNNIRNTTINDGTISSENQNQQREEQTESQSKLRESQTGSQTCQQIRKVAQSKEDIEINDNQNEEGSETKQEGFQDPSDDNTLSQPLSKVNLPNQPSDLSANKTLQRKQENQEGIDAQKQDEEEDINRNTKLNDKTTTSTERLGDHTKQQKQDNIHASPQNSHQQSTVQKQQSSERQKEIQNLKDIKRGQSRQGENSSERVQDAEEETIVGEGDQDKITEKGNSQPQDGQQNKKRYSNNQETGRDSAINNEEKLTKTTEGQGQPEEEQLEIVEDLEFQFDNNPDKYKQRDQKEKQNQLNMPDFSEDEIEAIDNPQSMTAQNDKAERNNLNQKPNQNATQQPQQYDSKDNNKQNQQSGQPLGIAPKAMKSSSAAQQNNKTNETADKEEPSSSKSQKKQEGNMIALNQSDGLQNNQNVVSSNETQQQLNSGNQNKSQNQSHATPQNQGIRQDQSNSVQQPSQNSGIAQQKNEREQQQLQQFSQSQRPVRQGENVFVGDNSPQILRGISQQSDRLNDERNSLSSSTPRNQEGTNNVTNQSNQGSQYFHVSSMIEEETNLRRKQAANQMRQSLDPAKLTSSQTSFSRSNSLLNKAVLNTSISSQSGTPSKKVSRSNSMRYSDICQNFNNQMRKSQFQEQSKAANRTAGQKLSHYANLDNSSSSISSSKLVSPSNKNEVPSHMVSSNINKKPEQLLNMRNSIDEFNNSFNPADPPFLKSPTSSQGLSARTSAAKDNANPLKISNNNVNNDRPEAYFFAQGAISPIPTSNKGYFSPNDFLDSQEGINQSQEKLALKGNSSVSPKISNINQPNDKNIQSTRETKKSNEQNQQSDDITTQSGLNQNQANFDNKSNQTNSQGQKNSELLEINKIQIEAGGKHNIDNPQAKTTERTQQQNNNNINQRDGTTQPIIVSSLSQQQSQESSSASQVSQEQKDTIPRVETSEQNQLNDRQAVSQQNTQKSILGGQQSVQNQGMVSTPKMNEQSKTKVVNKDNSVSQKQQQSAESRQSLKQYDSNLNEEDESIVDSKLPNIPQNNNQSYNKDQQVNNMNIKDNQESQNNLPNNSKEQFTVGKEDIKDTGKNKDILRNSFNESESNNAQKNLKETENISKERDQVKKKEQTDKESVGIKPSPDINQTSPNHEMHDQHLLKGQSNKQDEVDEDGSGDNINTRQLKENLRVTSQLEEIGTSSANDSKEVKDTNTRVSDSSNQHNLKAENTNTAELNSETRSAGEGEEQINNLESQNKTNSGLKQNDIKQSTNQVNLSGSLPQTRSDNSNVQPAQSQNQRESAHKQQLQAHQATESNDSIPCDNGSQQAVQGVQSKDQQGLMISPQQKSGTGQQANTQRDQSSILNTQITSQDTLHPPQQTKHNEQDKQSTSIKENLPSQDISPQQESQELINPSSDQVKKQDGQHYLGQDKRQQIGIQNNTENQGVAENEYDSKESTPPLEQTSINNQISSGQQNQKKLQQPSKASPFENSSNSPRHSETQEEQANENRIEQKTNEANLSGEHQAHQSRQNNLQDEKDQVQNANDVDITDMEFKSIDEVKRLLSLEKHQITMGDNTPEQSNNKQSLFAIDPFKTKPTIPKDSNENIEHEEWAKKQNEIQKQHFINTQNQQKTEQAEVINVSTASEGANRQSKDSLQQQKSQEIQEQNISKNESRGQEIVSQQRGDTTIQPELEQAREEKVASTPLNQTSTNNQNEKKQTFMEFKAEKANKKEIGTSLLQEKQEEEKKQKLTADSQRSGLKEGIVLQDDQQQLDQEKQPNEQQQETEISRDIHSTNNQNKRSDDKGGLKQSLPVEGSENNLLKMAKRSVEEKYVRSSLNDDLRQPIAHASSSSNKQENPRESGNLHQRETIRQQFNQQEDNNNSDQQLLEELRSSISNSGKPRLQTSNLGSDRKKGKTIQQSYEERNEHHNTSYHSQHFIQNEDSENSSVNNGSSFKPFYDKNAAPAEGQEEGAVNIEATPDDRAANTSALQNSYYSSSFDVSGMGKNTKNVSLDPEERNRQQAIAELCNRELADLLHSTQEINNEENVNNQQQIKPVIDVIKKISDNSKVCVVMAMKAEKFELKRQFQAFHKLKLFCGVRKQPTNQNQEAIPANILRFKGNQLRRSIENLMKRFTKKMYFEFLVKIRKNNIIAKVIQQQQLSAKQIQATSNAPLSATQNQQFSASSIKLSQNSSSFMKSSINSSESQKIGPKSTKLIHTLHYLERSFNRLCLRRKQQAFDQIRFSNTSLRPTIDNNSYLIEQRALSQGLREGGSKSNDQNLQTPERKTKKQSSQLKQATSDSPQRLAEIQQKARNSQQMEQKLRESLPQRQQQTTFEQQEDQQQEKGEIANFLEAQDNIRNQQQISKSEHSRHFEQHGYNELVSELEKNLDTHGDRTVEDDNCEKPQFIPAYADAKEFEPDQYQRLSKNLSQEEQQMIQELLNLQKIQHSSNHSQKPSNQSNSKYSPHIQGGGTFGASQSGGINKDSLEFEKYLSQFNLNMSTSQPQYSNSQQQLHQQFQNQKQQMQYQKLKGANSMQQDVNNMIGSDVDAEQEGDYHQLLSQMQEGPLRHGYSMGHESEIQPHFQSSFTSPSSEYLSKIMNQSQQYPHIPEILQPGYVYKEKNKNLKVAPIGNYSDISQGVVNEKKLNEQSLKNPPSQFLPGYSRVIEAQKLYVSKQYHNLKQKLTCSTIMTSSNASAVQSPPLNSTLNSPPRNIAVSNSMCNVNNISASLHLSPRVSIAMNASNRLYDDAIQKSQAQKSRNKSSQSSLVSQKLSRQASQQPNSNFQSPQSSVMKRSSKLN